MKVFKFGGASVKSADAIRNMCSIIQSFHEKKLVVVVSAMGKSTNALEQLIDLAVNGKNYQQPLNSFKKYHVEIVNQLFQGSDSDVVADIEGFFVELEQSLNDETLRSSFPKYYDRIVSIGELLSTTIINHYLNQNGSVSTWLDARKLIRTDDTFQDGKVDWTTTTTNIEKEIIESNKSLFVTQGFISSTSAGETTTLGREGSDYSAAIFAACVDAESVTIWKDVPGILNADPKIIDDAVLFPELPYKEASEMTYYGAKVIHPNTIQPLANKGIPLHVRCFETPNKEGTIIHDCELDLIQPVIIYKENQCLISFNAKDLAFVNEQGLSVIFDVLHQLDIVINIMQNSAISFSVCIDYNAFKIERLIDVLHDDFSILYNTGLQLVTIKNYTEEALTKYRPKGTHLLEQVSRSNYRVLISTV